MRLVYSHELPGIELELDVVAEETEERRDGQRGDEQHREAILDRRVRIIVD